MAIQYDPRLQGKPNTTDILTGQEDLSQQQQDGSQAAPQAAQPQGTAQAAQPQQNAPQSNLATNKPKASSGMFTNVRQYIEKNKPAAQNMAKSIGSTVQRSADIARKNIQASQSQFGNLMEQGSLANRGSAVSDVRSAAERAAGMSAPQQAQAGQSTATEQPQQTIQPTPEMANQATGSVRKQQPYKSGLTREDILNGPSRPIQVGPVKPPSNQFDKFQTFFTGQPTNLITDRVRSTKPLPAFGTERDGQYYVGRGSSSQLSDITSGNFDNNRRVHTHDIRDMWVDKDTYDAYNEYRNSQDFTNRTSKDSSLPILGEKESQVETPAMSDADARIKSILDAQYKGPQRLEELGSFGQAQSKAQEAERLRQQLTGGNRQELLDKALERQGSKYTQGARRLDELLFGQGDPQQYLQNVQQQIGDVGQDLSSASQSARQDAINRARELSDIRSQAREALQSTATGRAGEVEQAIQDQIAAGGELADYYRNLLSESEGGLNLGSTEAQTLGVKSGAGLYTLLSDPVEREALLSNLDARDRLEAEKLISRDEQAQLAELQRLAQLSSDYGVADSGLDFRTQYQDADLAGTQNALAALNLQGFGDALTEAETRFREQAARDVTGIGTGKAKYNRGYGRGRGKVKKTAYQSANLKDILEAQGYDFESDPSQYITEADPNLLANLSNIASQSKGESVDVSEAGDFLDAIQGIGEGSLSSVLGPGTMSESVSRGLTGGGLAAATGAGAALAGLGATGFGAAAVPGFGQLAAGIALADIGSKAAESLGSDLEKARLFGDAGALVGRGVKDIGREIQGGFDSIFGGGKGEAKKKAQSKAQRAAIADLQKKLTGRLSSSGFSNRVNVADTEEAQARQKQLLDILGGIRNK